MMPNMSTNNPVRPTTPPPTHLELYSRTVTPWAPEKYDTELQYRPILAARRAVARRPTKPHPITSTLHRVQDRGSRISKPTSKPIPAPKLRSILKRSGASSKPKAKSNSKESRVSFPSLPCGPEPMATSSTPEASHYCDRTGPDGGCRSCAHFCASGTLGIRSASNDEILRAANEAVQEANNSNENLKVLLKAVGVDEVDVGVFERMICPGERAENAPKMVLGRMAKKV